MPSKKRRRRTIGTFSDPLTATIPLPPLPHTEGFDLGAWRRPDGATIGLDSYSLLLDGRRWTPAMGEFHYARYPEDEWSEELLKMRAGGIDIVATYVFWIHHEEVEGAFDWRGRRSLRRFVKAADEAGLKVIVRCGPWCHGEVRNGGLPDWVLKRNGRARSEDPAFLSAVRALYGEIAAQLDGLLWKYGGPVIGVQLDNEYGGPASYLVALKGIAREAGLDVPLYTRTGWPALSEPMPFGAMLPLYGGYAEGFWDRELTPMPGRYWAAFHFSTLRDDSNIANESLGRREDSDAPDAASYPYLTCEIGGGMMSSYHRRILVNPSDVESVTLVKLGSGSASPGYYMYHGGVNPTGRLTSLMESQANGEWNDLPVKTYDFQAPLGEYGQLRPHYHALRRMHLFLKDWGPELARMPSVMPDQRPSGRDDIATLRWAVRSDGEAGFVFVNNYQRLQPMPERRSVQFDLRLPGGRLKFPDEPIAIPADTCFIWPFNLDLGHGARLAWATAQPVCGIEGAGGRYVFFAETPGVTATFAVDAADSRTVEVVSGTEVRRDGRILVQGVEPGTGAAIRIFDGAAAPVNIVLLSDADSRSLWKGRWNGRETVFLTRAGLAWDDTDVRLASTNLHDLSVAVLPAPAAVTGGQARLEGTPDGIFTRYTPRRPAPIERDLLVEQIRTAGPPREIPVGTIGQPVAAAPEDGDFEVAAVWRIRLPHDLTVEDDPILRLHYVGDVARVILNGTLLTDDFYNGRPLEVGLRRHAPEILNGDLRIAILPLQRDAPVYMADEAWPDDIGEDGAVALRAAEIVPRFTARLRIAP